MQVTRFLSTPMMPRLATLIELIALLVAATQPARAEEHFVDLLADDSLQQWTIVGATSDSWTLEDGVLLCHGEKSPRHFLRSRRMYENFVLEVEWKLTAAGGNSGVFLYADALPQVGAPYPQSVEAQILDGDHGSVFGIRGASIEPLSTAGTKGKTVVARPSDERCRPVGEWNHYRLTCRSGVIELAVNGKTVTRAACADRLKGYVALQAEHQHVHFRNVRIRELPTADPPAERIAQGDEGYRPLFDGVSFDGWKHLPGHRGHWIVEDGVIKYDGQAAEPKRADKDLWTVHSFGDFRLVADWRLPAKPTMMEHPVVLPNGDFVYLEGSLRKTFSNLDAGDSGLYFRGSPKAQLNIWSQNLGSGEINGYRTDRSLPAEVRLGCIPSHKADKPFGEWNRFEVTVRGDAVSVDLNGETVIDDVRLPDLPRTGPIALQHHGDPVEFRNLFVRRIE